MFGIALRAEAWQPAKYKNGRQTLSCKARRPSKMQRASRWKQIWVGGLLICTVAPKKSSLFTIARGLTDTGALVYDLSADFLGVQLVNNDGPAFAARV